MAGSDKKLSVVVTGQVRDPDVFVRSLEAFKDNPAVGRVVLATWEDEAEAHAQFLNKMTYDYDLSVVTATEPPQWSGNLLSQMVALYMGLGSVDADGYVLRTRTDVFIEPARLDHALSQDLSLSPPEGFAGFPNILEEKIYAWGIETTSPFYIHDLFFMGRHADMTKLVNMDIRYDLLYHMTKEKVHIRRFLHPFLHHFPVFEKFLHASHLLGLTDEFPGPYRRFVLGRLLENQIYVKILALYYVIIATCFTCDWGPGKIFQWREDLPLKSFEPGSALGDYFLQGAGEKALMSDGNALFESVTAGDFASCKVGERFTQAMEYLRGLDDLGQACMEEDFGAFLDAALNIGEEASAMLRAEAEK